MEVLTGIFIAALYKAIETIWEQSVKAAWKPGSEAIKERFFRLAGKDQESQRRAAFTKAAQVAHANTLRQAADHQQAAKILDVLNSEQDRRGAEALAEEAAKLMLFSTTPDVPRLAAACQRALRFEALLAGETPPVSETAVVLSDFLTNLREALLDQEPYHDLIQREMLRTLRQIAAPPVAHDTEATYCAQLAAMHRELEFVGIPELKERRPITVEDIFIHLRAEREVEVSEVPPGISEVAMTQRVGKEPGELWELRERPWVVRERVGIDEALRETKRLVVLGDPGAGKTMLLKYLTVICAEGRAEIELGIKADGVGSPLPVFIPLREFAAECAGRDQDYCLLDYLYTNAHKHLMLNLQRGFFENALDAGRCLVCLDGLDEVWAVGQRKMVCDEVKALAAKYPNSRYIVTSRLVGYGEAPLDRRNFTHHTILPFEDDDIRQFVRQWYEMREHDPLQRKQKAEDLIATIAREPRIKDLATNPLLLTIIALVHRIEAELPHERVKLYDKCVTALVDTWEEVKGLTIEEKQRPFYRYRRRLLERLAYELHTRAEKPGQMQTVKEGDLELLLTNFLRENRRLGLADDPDGAREEARAFIRLARGRTGLLVERGEGIFTFPHLTFQEYLAACDIENRCIHRGVDAIWEEIKDRLHDPHWREVILLLLGSLNKYDEPPTLLVERILEAGKGDKFEPVLHRHLYLAASALADRVAVADVLHRAIIRQLLTIIREGHISFVIDLMGEPHTEGEARDALTTLGNLKGDPYAAEGLLALARDLQVVTMLRYSAASTLVQLGRIEEAVGFLLTLACDLQVETWIRSLAASALGQLGHTDERVLDSLLALVSNPHAEARGRVEAAVALGQLGSTEEAAEVLLSLIGDSQVENWVREYATWALERLGCIKEKVLDGLLALAHDPQVEIQVRNTAVWALRRLGRTNEKALDGLLMLARDPQVEAHVRYDAATALGRLDRSEEKVLDVLLAIAHDLQVNGEVRCAAVYAMGRLGRTDERMLESLRVLACDQKVEIQGRVDAVLALGQLGCTQEAVEILLALADDPQVEARGHLHAAWGLGDLGRTEEAAEVLLSLAQDPQVEFDVRYQAAAELGPLGRSEKKVLDGLLAIASDLQIDGGMRRIATRVLGQLGRADEKVLDGLLTLARNPQVEDWGRNEAYGSLKRLVGGLAA